MIDEEDEPPKKKRKGWGKICCLWNCSNYSSKDGIAVFSFPKPDKEPVRHAKWVRVVKHTRADFTYNATSSFICAAHFPEESFANLTKIRLLREKNPFDNTRWKLMPDAVPLISLPPPRPRPGSSLQSTPLADTTNVRSTPRQPAVPKREHRRDEVGVSGAGADSACSSMTDPVWSGQGKTLGRNQEIIGRGRLRTKKKKTEQNSSDKCLDSNEPEVYIDVAENLEDSRKRKHSIGDDEEFLSVSDGREYIKSEDGIGVKIEISQEYFFDDSLGDQDTVKDRNKVEDINHTNIKQEPDDEVTESNR